MLSQEKELPYMDRGGIEPPGRLARVPTDPPPPPLLPPSTLYLSSVWIQSLESQS